MALSTRDMQAMTYSVVPAPDDFEGGMTLRDGWTAFLLGLYLLGCGAITLYFMAHVWAGSLVLLEAILPGIGFSEGQVKDVQTFVYTTCGAVVGALILSFHGLHKYAVVLQTFRIRYSGSYLLGPWAAGLIGIATYAMLRGRPARVRRRGRRARQQFVLRLSRDRHHDRVRLGAHAGPDRRRRPPGVREPQAERVTRAQAAARAASG